jgi:hypothetical protein
MSYTVDIFFPQNNSGYVRDTSIYLPMARSTMTLKLFHDIENIAFESDYFKISAMDLGKCDAVRIDQGQSISVLLQFSFAHVSCTGNVFHSASFLGPFIFEETKFKIVSHSQNIKFIGKRRPKLVVVFQYILYFVSVKRL